MAKRTIEERVEYELERRTEWSDLRDYFNCAIININKGWTKKYIDDTKEVACRIMTISGFCSGFKCEHCYLYGAHENATNRIEEKKEVAPDNTRRIQKLSDQQN